MSASKNSDLDIKFYSDLDMSIYESFQETADMVEEYSLIYAAVWCADNLKELKKLIKRDLPKLGGFFIWGFGGSHFWLKQIGREDENILIAIEN